MSKIEDIAKRFLQFKYYECEYGDYNHNSIFNSIINYCPNCYRKIKISPILEEMTEETVKNYIKKENKKYYDKAFSKIVKILEKRKNK